MISSELSVKMKEGTNDRVIFLKLLMMGLSWILLHEQT